jgi:DUF4097 and DUF4098 domain-containing protein YvlB
MNTRLIALAVGLAVVVGLSAPWGSSQAHGREAAVQGTVKSIHERRALNHGGKISVRNTVGSVQVTAWAQSELELTGSLGAGVERLLVSGSATDLTVEVQLKKGDRQWLGGDTQLMLKVPSGVELQLETTSADIQLEGLAGMVRAKTVSGDVEADVQSQDVQLQSVSGDINIIAAQGRQLGLTTVSGDVHVQGASGVLTAESVSGDIFVTGGSFGQLRLKSVSGDLEVTAAALPDAVVRAESLSGDVQLNTTAALDARLSLKSFSGEKRCNLKATPTAAEGRRTLYTLGEGRAQISLTSFSGDVMVSESLPR